MNKHAFQDYLDQVNASVSQNYQGDVGALLRDNLGRIGDIYASGETAEFAAECLVEDARSSNQVGLRRCS